MGPHIGESFGIDLDAPLLECHQGVQRIDPRVEARRNQAGEHTGNRGAVLRLIEQRVVALADEELQGALHHIIGLFAIIEASV